MKMKRLKKTLTAMAVSSVLTFGTSAPAYAQYPTYDAVSAALQNWGFALLDGAIAVASEAQLALETFYGEANIYMQTGLASVMSAASSANVAAQKQVIEGMDQLGTREQMQNAQQLGAMKSLTITEESMPHPIGCASATSADLVGGSSPASAAVNAAVMQKVASNAFSSKSEPNNFGARVASHFKDPEQCDATDVAQQRNGCSSVGSRAGADMLVASLFMGAGTGSAVLSKNAAFKAPDYTFTKEQFETASNALANIGAANMPTLIDPKAESTPAGRGYLAMSNIVKARASIVQDALASILSKRVGPDVAGGAPIPAGLQASWTAYSAFFQKMYPGRAQPAIPSEYEAIKLSVMRRAGDNSFAVTLQDAPQQKLLAEQVATLADTNYLLFNMWEQQEKQTALLAGMLAQQLDPVTKDALNSQRDAAMRSAGGR